MVNRCLGCRCKDKNLLSIINKPPIPSIFALHWHPNPALVGAFYVIVKLLRTFVAISSVLPLTLRAQLFPRLIIAGD